MGSVMTDDQKAWDELVKLAEESHRLNVPTDWSRGTLYAAAIVQRAGDVEGMAKELWKADKPMSRMGTWECLVPRIKDLYRDEARALSAFLKGEG